MELKEEMVSQQTVYEGIIVNVRRDKARLLDGRIANREVVEHPGGVAILALDREDNVAVVRQYRYPFHKVLLELPAGKLEPGEDPRVCGVRELEEEVGLVADEFIYLGGLYLSPGYSNEVLHLYLARGLRQGACHPDEDEFLEGERIPFARLVDMVMADEIHDAKTVAAVLKAKVYLERT